MRLLIAGYGGASGHTAGVFDTNELRFVWESGVPSISYMCVNPETGVLYGAGEYQGYGKVFLFTPEGGGYRLADTHTVPGGYLCHVAYSPAHHLLAGACYESGDLFTLSVDGDCFKAMTTYIKQGGTLQPGTVTRAHCATFGIDERYLYSANIALDRLYVYEIDKGALAERGVTDLPPGTGPRHVLPLSAHRLFILTEYSNELLCLHMETPDKPTVTEALSTLPPDFTGKSSGSTLLCHAGFIYAANRGANTVAVFKQAGDDHWVKIMDCPCGGNWPRHIAVVGEKTERPMLAVTNERSGYVSLCPLQPDGAVGQATVQIPFGGASFVCELA